MIDESAFSVQIDRIVGLKIFTWKLELSSIYRFVRRHFDKQNIILIQNSTAIWFCSEFQFIGFRLKHFQTTFLVPIKFIWCFDSNIFLFSHSHVVYETVSNGFFAPELNSGKLFSINNREKHPSLIKIYCFRNSSGLTRWHNKHIERFWQAFNDFTLPDWSSKPPTVRKLIWQFATRALFREWYNWNVQLL